MKSNLHLVPGEGDERMIVVNGRKPIHIEDLLDAIKISLHGLIYAIPQDLRFDGDRAAQRAWADFEYNVRQIPFRLSRREQATLADVLNSENPTYVAAARRYMKLPNFISWLRLDNALTRKWHLLALYQLERLIGRDNCRFIAIELQVTDDPNQSSLDGLLHVTNEKNPYGLPMGYYWIEVKWNSRGEADFSRAQRHLHREKIEDLAAEGHVIRGKIQVLVQPDIEIEGARVVGQGFVQADFRFRPEALTDLTAPAISPFTSHEMDSIIKKPVNALQVFEAIASKSASGPLLPLHNAPNIHGMRPQMREGRQDNNAAAGKTQVVMTAPDGINTLGRIMRAESIDKIPKPVFSTFMTRAFPGKERRRGVDLGTGTGWFPLQVAKCLPRGFSLAMDGTDLEHRPFPSTEEYIRRKGARSMDFVSSNAPDVAGYYFVVIQKADTLLKDDGVLYMTSHRLNYDSGIVAYLLAHGYEICLVPWFQKGPEFSDWEGGPRHGVIIASRSNKFVFEYLHSLGYNSVRMSDKLSRLRAFFWSGKAYGIFHNLDETAAHLKMSLSEFCRGINALKLEGLVSHVRGKHLSQLAGTGGMHGGGHTFNLQPAQTMALDEAQALPTKATKAKKIQNRGALLPLHKTPNIHGMSPRTRETRQDENPAEPYPVWIITKKKSEPILQKAIESAEIRALVQALPRGEKIYVTREGGGGSFSVPLTHEIRQQLSPILLDSQHLLEPGFLIHVGEDAGAMPEKDQINFIHRQIATIMMLRTYKNQQMAKHVLNLWASALSSQHSAVELAVSYAICEHLTLKMLQARGFHALARHIASQDLSQQQFSELQFLKTDTDKLGGYLQMLLIGVVPFAQSDPDFARQQSQRLAYEFDYSESESREILGALLKQNLDFENIDWTEADFLPNLINSVSLAYCGLEAKDKAGPPLSSHLNRISAWLGMNFRTKLFWGLPTLRLSVIPHIGTDLMLFAVSTYRDGGNLVFWDRKHGMQHFETDSNSHLVAKQSIPYFKTAPRENGLQLIRGGQLLVVTTRLGQVICWSLLENRVLSTLEADRASFSEDGESMIFSRDHEVTIQTKAGSRTYQTKHLARSVAMSGSGNMAAWLENDGRVYVVSTAADAAPKDTTLAKDGVGITLNDDGSRFAVWDNGNGVEVFTADKYSPDFILNSSTTKITQVCFANDRALFTMSRPEIKNGQLIPAKLAYWQLPALVHRARAWLTPKESGYQSMSQSLQDDIELLKQKGGAKTLGERILALERLNEAGVLLPFEVIQEYRDLPSMAAKQAALVAGFLYRSGHQDFSSVDSLKALFKQLYDLEKSAMTKNGHDDQFGIELHSGILEMDNGQEILRSKHIKRLLEAFMRVDENRGRNGQLKVATLFEDGGLEYQTLPAANGETLYLLWTLLEKVSDQEGFDLLETNGRWEDIWLHFSFNGVLHGFDTQFTVEGWNSSNAELSKYGPLKRAMRPKFSEKYLHWDVRDPRPSKLHHLGNTRTEITGMMAASSDPRDRQLFHAYLRHLLFVVPEARRAHRRETDEQRLSWSAFVANLNPSLPYDEQGHYQLKAFASQLGDRYDKAAEINAGTLNESSPAGAWSQEEPLLGNELNLLTLSHPDTFVFDRDGLRYQSDGERDRHFWIATKILELGHIPLKKSDLIPLRQFLGSRDLVVAVHFDQKIPKEDPRDVAKALNPALLAKCIPKELPSAARTQPVPILDLDGKQIGQWYGFVARAALKRDQHGREFFRPVSFVIFKGTKTPATLTYVLDPRWTFNGPEKEERKSSLTNAGALLPVHNAPNFHGMTPSADGQPEAGAPLVGSKTDARQLTTSDVERLKNARARLNELAANSPASEKLLLNEPAFGAPFRLTKERVWTLSNREIVGLDLYFGLTGPVVKDGATVGKMLQAAGCLDSRSTGIMERSNIRRFFRSAYQSAGKPERGSGWKWLTSDVNSKLKTPLSIQDVKKRFRLLDISEAEILMASYGLNGPVTGTVEETQNVLEEKGIRGKFGPVTTKTVAQYTVNSLEKLRGAINEGPQSLRLSKKELSPELSALMSLLPEETSSPAQIFIFQFGDSAWPIFKFLTGQTDLNQIDSYQRLETSSGSNRQRYELITPSGSVQFEVERTERHAIKLKREKIRSNKAARDGLAPAVASYKIGNGYWFIVKLPQGKPLTEHSVSEEVAHAVGVALGKLHLLTIAAQITDGAQIFLQATSHGPVAAFWDSQRFRTDRATGLHRKRDYYDILKILLGSATSPLRDALTASYLAGYQVGRQLTTEDLRPFQRKTGSITTRKGWIEYFQGIAKSINTPATVQTVAEASGELTVPDIYNVFARFGITLEQAGLVRQKAAHNRRATEQTEKLSVVDATVNEESASDEQNFAEWKKSRKGAFDAVPLVRRRAEEAQQKAAAAVEALSVLMTEATTARTEVSVDAVSKVDSSVLKTVQAAVLKQAAKVEELATQALTDAKECASLDSTVLKAVEDLEQLQKEWLATETFSASVDVLQKLAPLVERIHEAVRASDQAHHDLTANQQKSLEAAQLLRQRLEGFRSVYTNVTKNPYPRLPLTKTPNIHGMTPGPNDEFGPSDDVPHRGHVRPSSSQENLNFNLNPELPRDQAVRHLLTRVLGLDPSPSAELGQPSSLERIVREWSDNNGFITAVTPTGTQRGFLKPDQLLEYLSNLSGTQAEDDLRLYRAVLNAVNRLPLPPAAQRAFERNLWTAYLQEHPTRVMRAMTAVRAASETLLQLQQAIALDYLRTRDRDTLDRVVRPYMLGWLRAHIFTEPFLAFETPRELAVAFISDWFTHLRSLGEFNSARAQLQSRMWMETLPILIPGFTVPFSDEQSPWLTKGSAAYRNALRTALGFSVYHDEPERRDALASLRMDLSHDHLQILAKERLLALGEGPSTVGRSLMSLATAAILFLTVMLKQTVAAAAAIGVIIQGGAPAANIQLNLGAAAPEKVLEYSRRVERIVGLMRLHIPEFSNFFLPGENNVVVINRVTDVQPTWHSNWSKMTFGTAQYNFTLHDEAFRSDEHLLTDLVEAFFESQGDSAGNRAREVLSDLSLFTLLPSSINGIQLMVDAELFLPKPPASIYPLPQNSAERLATAAASARQRIQSDPKLREAIPASVVEKLQRLDKVRPTGVDLSKLSAEELEALQVEIAAQMTSLHNERAQLHNELRMNLIQPPQSSVEARRREYDATYIQNFRHLIVTDALISYESARLELAMLNSISGGKPVEFMQRLIALGSPFAEKYAALIQIIQSNDAVLKKLSIDDRLLYTSFPSEYEPAFVLFAQKQNPNFDPRDREQVAQQKLDLLRDNKYRTTKRLGKPLERISWPGRSLLKKVAGYTVALAASLLLVMETNAQRLPNAGILYDLGTQPLGANQELSMSLNRGIEIIRQHDATVDRFLNSLDDRKTLSVKVDPSILASDHYFLILNKNNQRTNVDLRIAAAEMAQPNALLVTLCEALVAAEDAWKNGGLSKTPQQSLHALQVVSRIALSEIIPQPELGLELIERAGRLVEQDNGAKAMTAAQTNLIDGATILLSLSDRHPGAVAIDRTEINRLVEQLKKDPQSVLDKNLEATVTVGTNGFARVQIWLAAHLSAPEATVLVARMAQMSAPINHTRLQKLSTLAGDFANSPPPANEQDAKRQAQGYKQIATLESALNTEAAQSEQKILSLIALEQKTTVAALLRAFILNGSPLAENHWRTLMAMENRLAAFKNLSLEDRMLLEVSLEPLYYQQFRGMAAHELGQQQISTPQYHAWLLNLLKSNEYRSTTSTPASASVDPVVTKLIQGMNSLKALLEANPSLMSDYRADLLRRLNELSSTNRWNLEKQATDDTIIDPKTSTITLPLEFARSLSLEDTPLALLSLLVNVEDEPYKFTQWFSAASQQLQAALNRRDQFSRPERQRELNEEIKRTAVLGSYSQTPGALARLELLRARANEKHMTLEAYLREKLRTNPSTPALYQQMLDLLINRVPELAQFTERERVMIGLALPKNLVPLLIQVSAQEGVRFDPRNPQAFYNWLRKILSDRKYLTPQSFLGRQRANLGNSPIGPTEVSPSGSGLDAEALAADRLVESFRNKTKGDLLQTDLEHIWEIGSLNVSSIDGHGLNAANVAQHVEAKMRQTNLTIDSDAAWKGIFRATFGNTKKTSAVGEDLISNTIEFYARQLRDRDFAMAVNLDRQDFKEVEVTIRGALRKTRGPDAHKLLLFVSRGARQALTEKLRREEDFDRIEFFVNSKVFDETGFIHLKEIARTLAMSNRLETTNVFISDRQGFDFSGVPEVMLNRMTFVYLNQLLQAVQVQGQQVEKLLSLARAVSINA